MTARKPRTAKVLANTYRADRAPAADPKAGERLDEPPAPPPTLSPRGMAEWHRIAPAACGLGTVMAADLRALELLCEALAVESEARETVQREGFVTMAGSGGVKPHPALRVAENARTQASKLLSDFGLTPRGREGVSILPKSGPSVWDEFDAMDRLLSSPPPR